MGEHLDLSVELRLGEFRAPPEKVGTRRLATSLAEPSPIAAGSPPGNQPPLHARRMSSTSPSPPPGSSCGSCSVCWLLSWAVRQIENDASATTGLRLVGCCSAGEAQRAVDLQTDRNGVPTRGLQ